MPMKNKAGGCNCCGGCVITEITIESGLSADSTQVMDSTTYNVYDLTTPTGLQTLYASYTESNFYDNWYLIKLTGGDWWRVKIPAVSSRPATQIDKSTDSGSSWTTILDLTKTTQIDNYKNGEDSSGNPVIATTTHVGDNPDRERSLIVGNTANDCYLGWSPTELTTSGPGDNTWIPTTDLEIWDVTAGKSILTNGMVESIGFDSIASVHFLTATAAADGRYAILGSYDDYNCASGADPNCGTICPLSFPNVALHLTSASFTLTNATHGKTVALSDDFSANDGYDFLQDGNISEFISTDVITKIQSYDTASKAEWVTNGYEVKYIMRNGGVDRGNPTAACLFEGETQIDWWWPQPEYYYRIGFGGNFSNLGSRQFLSEYNWTVADDGDVVSPTRRKVTAFTSSMSTLYNGGVDSATDQHGVSFEVSVVDETDCSVTIELTMTDQSLQHGSTSIISGGDPIFETTPTYTPDSTGFGSVNWDFDHTYNWEFPYETPGVNAPVIEVANINPQAGTTLGGYGAYLAYHEQNTGTPVPGNQVEFATPTSPTITQNTPADADWKPWEVTWRKSVLKSDLDTASPTITFSGSDVTSTNFVGSRTTLTPPDYSASAEHAYNQAFLFPDGSSTGARMCTVYRPYGYTKSTLSIAGSDWSASITLESNPYYE